MRRPLTVEGVTYRRFVVRFAVWDEARQDWVKRRWVRYSPAVQFARHEIARELVERFGEHRIKHHSVTLREILP